MTTGPLIPPSPSTSERRALRIRLRALRDQLAGSPDHGKAEASLAGHLAQILEQLAPDRLGLYWAMRSEFNAATACLGNEGLLDIPFALPFVRRTAREMDYRAWNRAAPDLRDECDIPTTAGAVVVPDVVLAPCLGYTADGFRLGYGGGYFDRWLASHPHVTAIGVAWSATEVDRATLDPQAHDIPMMMIVTERGIVGA